MDPGRCGEFSATIRLDYDLFFIECDHERNRGVPR